MTMTTTTEFRSVTTATTLNWTKELIDKLLNQPMKLTKKNGTDYFTTSSSSNGALAILTMMYNEELHSYVYHLSLSNVNPYHRNWIFQTQVIKLGSYPKELITNSEQHSETPDEYFLNSLLEKLFLF